MAAHVIRRIAFTTLAALAAFELLLAYRLGAVGMPGLFLMSFGPASGNAKRENVTAGTGESVIVRQPLARRSAEPADKPIPAAPSGEPSLRGLTDIPLAPLVREKGETNEKSAKSPLSGAKEELPWDAIEPVPLSSIDPSDATDDSEALLKPSIQEPHAVSDPPPSMTDTEIRSWIRTKGAEVKGEDRGRALYHFEIWLEPPTTVRKSLVAVGYDFSSPVVMPQNQMSTDKETGFRVSAGALACPDEISVTLKFAGNATRSVVVDGCKLLGTD